MPGISSTLRQSARRVFRRPAFFLIAIVMLALGIGANTAIYSVIHTALFEPLPFTDAERLVRVWENNLSRGWEFFSTSESNFLDFRDRSTVFEDLAAFGGTSLNLADEGGALRLNALRATADFFPVLDIQPIAGRLFTPEEDQPGGDNQVVLLGNGFWREQFDADPQIVGKTLTLNGLPYAVVGVLPDGEVFLDGVDIFVPLAPSPDYSRGDHRIAMVGRLKPGVTPDEARTDLGAIADMLGEMYPESNEGWGITLLPFREWLVSDDLRTALWALMAAVGFVLLIVCANLANMLLAQAAGRGREIAIRTALGAGRWRIVGQIAGDAFLLAFIGGILGVLLAIWGTDILRLLGQGRLPWTDLIRVHTPVLLFALVVTFIVGIISAVFPALQATRSQVAHALKEGARTASEGRGKGLTRSVLVSAQIAIAMVLLVGAGLMVRSFSLLQGVDPGFALEGRLTVQMTVPRSVFPSADAFRSFYPELIERLEAIPGVERAATINALPMGNGATSMEIQAEGQVAAEDGSLPSANWRLVSPGYFETIGVPLLRGRTFQPVENLEETIPIVITRSLAEQMWPGEDPLGHRALLWARPNQIGVVIGVVADMRERTLDGDPTNMVYLPILDYWPEMPLVLRTSVTPTSIADEVRAVVADINPDIALSNFQSMRDIAEGALIGPRFYMTLLTIFSIVAAVLAAAGIYGVTAYVVSQRTSEIGIRMALGARSTSVVGLFLRKGMLLAGIGVVAGLAGALGLSRLLSGILYSISPADPVTYVAVALLAVVVTLGACYLPARRAARVDPIRALRVE